MSELALQHERWTVVRERLHAMPAKAKRAVLRLVPPEPAPTKEQVKRDIINLYGFDPQDVAALRWQVILHDVAQEHDLTVPELLARRRQRNVVHARQLLFYRLYRETSMSLPEIGRKCGGFDHTTILHSIRKHQARISQATASDSPTIHSSSQVV